ncbi:unnamed protein product [Effrenium voratum]|nr:unnamed protein product [Effrenium voratum]
MGKKEKLPGARSGGVTAHIQGPHLIPNVGREAMLAAEVVRRRPKNKAKPAPEARASNSIQAERRKKRKSRSLSCSRSRTKVSEIPSSPRDIRQSPSLSHCESESPQDTAEAQREARRMAEEQRQLQLLREAQEKRKKQENERKKNLGGVFALSADDFEKEEQPKRAQARSELLQHPKSATSKSVGSGQPRKERVLLDEAAPGSGFEKCWKNWDFAKAEDPAELARQFMRVTAAKRRGYAPRRSRSRSRSRR